MPTNRRRKRRQLIPSGLAEITSLEQTHWAVYGPDIGDHNLQGYTLWEDWQIWAQFYATVREEFLAQRRNKNPACERIYQGILAGRDPEAVCEEIRREQEENDPRKLLGRE
jgi:hypothetical protein